MCGLVGVFGDIDHRMRQVFQDLLMMDVVRGKDSTGVCVMNTGVTPTIVKATIAPQHLLNSGALLAAARKENLGFIGHNRAATRGEVNRDNAHPFRSGTIFGAHNGTLHNLWNLDKGTEFDTDSEALFFNINKNGIDKTWASMQGAAAVTWFNSRTKTLNFMRNDQRPLFYFVTKDEKTLVWASEAWMLKGVTERRHIQIKENVFYPLTNTLFTWSFKDGKVTDTARNVQPYTTPVAAGYKGRGADRSYEGAHKLRPNTIVGEDTDWWETFGGDEDWDSYPIAKRYNTHDEYREAMVAWCAKNKLDIPEAAWEEDRRPTKKDKEKDTPNDPVLLVPTPVNNGIGEAVKKYLEKDKDDKKDNPWDWSCWSPAKTGISKRAFKRDYGHCVGCNESLAEEYHTCVIIDRKKAMCAQCVEQAELHGMDMNSLQAIN